MININEHCKQMEGYMLKLNKGEKNLFPWKVQPRKMIEKKEENEEINRGEKDE